MAHGNWTGNKELWSHFPAMSQKVTRGECVRDERAGAGRTVNGECLCGSAGVAAIKRPGGGKQQGIVIRLSGRQLGIAREGDHAEVTQHGVAGSDPCASVRIDGDIADISQIDGVVGDVGGFDDSGHQIGRCIQGNLDKVIRFRRDVIEVAVVVEEVVRPVDRRVTSMCRCRRW